MFGFITGRPRLFAAAAMVGLAYWLLPAALNLHTRLLCAWDCGVLIYLGLTAIVFFADHIDRIPKDAHRQQEGEWTVFAITVAVVMASFVSIFGEFSSTKELHGLVKYEHVALVALTLMASWLMLHATFCFRYAHEYYTKTTPPDFDKGLDFPGDQPPDYLDFFYFSLVLGMTFQVSDVEITSRKLRRLALLQGLLSFLFNTIILALSVNIGASLM